jgi:hypothetical protein
MDRSGDGCRVADAAPVLGGFGRGDVLLQSGQGSTHLEHGSPSYCVPLAFLAAYLSDCHRQWPTWPPATDRPQVIAAR